MEADVQLKRAVGDWPAISTAIECLGLQDCITSSDVRLALQRAHNAEGEAEYSSAETAAKILLRLRLGDTYDGSVARKSAQAGAAAFLDLVLSILRGVSSERAEPSAKRRSKPALGVSSVLRPPSCYRSGSGFRLQHPRRRRMSAVFVKRQHRAVSTRRPIGRTGMRCVSGHSVQSQPKALWKWRSASTPRNAACSRQEGGYIGSDLSALQAERSIKLTVEEHFAAFKGKDGAGAIDVLMLPDPATGELLPDPETEHAELATHVRAQMQAWTCDKAYGSRTLPVTQNAADVMYNCWFDIVEATEGHGSSRTKP